MDWKEALIAKSREMGIESEATSPETTTEDTPQDPLPLSDKLHIIMERKGRAGKTATIIDGFTCSAEQLKQIATRLKQSLGTGGSTRGSQILIQGDRRDDIRAMLLGMGYKHVSR